MEYYVGITIGPIVQTLELASKPASLWCASSMFSWLSEDLCNRVIKNDWKLFCPFYEEPKEDIKEYCVSADGIGKYHDRLFFKATSDNEEILRKTLTNMISLAKDSLAEKLVGNQENLIKIIKIIFIFVM
ncbi:hypothetical protein P261_00110 [Lachnospiraceae bacterium TWA4]|nr:hypothetical protein P261_00110 [Lachnospiraceae bacterium TWA4]